MRLTVEEGRVLGCLVEKQLTTPQLYPLTDNAVVAACNQSTSRYPVVSYDKGTVRLAIRTLRERELLRTVHRTGERSDKHKHLLDTALSLTAEQLGLLAVLLLRGPQTLSELRTRTERLYPFDTLEQVEAALSVLSDRAEPLVGLLERQPGRKEIRYTQLMAEGLAPEGRDSELVDTPRAAPRAAGAPVTPVLAPTTARSDLADQVAVLRTEVAALRAELGALSTGPAGGDPRR